MGTGLPPLLAQHPRKHWIFRVHAIPRLHQPCVRLVLAPTFTAHRPRLEHKRRAAAPTMTVDEHRPRGILGQQRIDRRDGIGQRRAWIRVVVLLVLVDQKHLAPHRMARKCAARAAQRDDRPIGRRLRRTREIGGVDRKIGVDPRGSALRVARRERDRLVTKQATRLRSLNFPSITTCQGSTTTQLAKIESMSLHLRARDSDRMHQKLSFAPAPRQQALDSPAR